MYVGESLTLSYVSSTKRLSHFHDAAAFQVLGHQSNLWLHTVRGKQIHQIDVVTEVSKSALSQE